jgi:O-methyltransferase involved in polyketide biosynthesis
MQEIKRQVTDMQKYHIEKDTVQETLVIPLYGRKVCSERFPHLFKDPDAERICNMLDYDFSEKGKKMESAIGLFGALEVSQRQFDVGCEVKEYLSGYPRAAVVNMGCGLDNTFRKCDNGLCRGYNIDMPDVIEVRNRLLPAGEREQNLAFDLNDDRWMDGIDASDGAVFFAAGVFYYFRTEDVKALFRKMAKRFPGAVLVFDSCNRRGTRLMMKTWLKEAGIRDVGAFFFLEDPNELNAWSEDFASVTSKSYMRGYRDIYREVGLLHKLMIRFCDSAVNMQIVKISFRPAKSWPKKMRAIEPRNKPPWPATVRTAGTPPATNQ